MEAMNRIIWTSVCTVLMASVSAQTVNRPATNAVVGPGQNSNQDLNMRAYVELLRSDIRSSKAQIVGQVMQLNTDEATKFWPVYKAFETDLSKIGDDIVSLIKMYSENYGNMTAQRADELATRLLDIERQRIELKAVYYGKMKAAVDTVTAARFLQVENQLEKLMDLQIASNLPVIE
jgi:hypothetical protein